MLTQQQTSKICLLHGGANQCRYLKIEGGWSQMNCFCLRQLSAKKKEIDKKVKDHIADCKKKNIDPYRIWGMSLGDGAGCKGFPYLKHVQQGLGATP